MNIVGLLLLLCVLVNANTTQIDTLPFPEFHREYFDGDFWNRKSESSHPYSALRKPLSVENLDSLFAVDSLKAPYDDALYFYNLTRGVPYSDSLKEVLFKKFSKVKSDYWKSRILLEIKEYLNKAQKFDEIFKLLAKNKDLDKHFNKRQQKEFRLLELEKYLAQKDFKSIKKYWTRYLTMTKKKDRHLLKDFTYNELLPKYKKMSIGELEVLVSFLRKLGDKKKALEIVEIYPGSKLAKKSNVIRYYNLLAAQRYSAKDYKGQVRVLKKTYALLKTKNSKARILDKLIRSHRKMGLVKLEDSLRIELERLIPKSSRLAGQLWLKAFELEQEEKYQKAKAKYLELHKKFPGHKRQVWASFRAGLVEYKQGKFVKARVQFDRALKSRQKLWPRSASLYFRALSYEKQGEDSLAKAAYYETIDDYPLGYFAWRARQKLYATDVAISEIPSITTFEASRDSVWSWFHKGTPKDSTPQKDVLLEDLEKILASGAWHFVDPLLRSKKKWSFIDWVDFGELYNKYGFLAKSYAMGRKILNRMPRQRMYHFPSRFKQLMYPEVFPQEVKTSMKSTGLDPEFIWALMRQESIFNDQISSPVGAAGLMQIMDYTGKELAAAESLKVFEARWLKNPLYAIRLGTRYIKDLYVEYQNTDWVLTNYNAGPKPTRRWIRQTKGQEHDVKLENISYWETRDYVKKVTGNYYNFKILNSDSFEEVLKSNLKYDKPVKKTSKDSIIQKSDSTKIIEVPKDVTVDSAKSLEAVAKPILEKKVSKPDSSKSSKEIPVDSLKVQKTVKKDSVNIPQPKTVKDSVKN